MSEGSTAQPGNRVPRAINALITLIVAGYTLGVTLPLFVSLVFGDRWWPVALYNTFAHLLWIPALMLVPLLLILRRWRAALLVLPPALAFLLIFGIRFLPRPVPEVTGRPSPLSVMTYNIQWRDSNYADTISIIENADAEIVAIQELGMEAANILEAELLDRYPYSELHPQDWGIYGQGIFSKYPISSSNLSDYWQSEGSFGNQRAVIEYKDLELAVYNVHPVHPRVSGRFFDPGLRAIGISDILQTIDQDDFSYMILLGDFNMPELSSDYRAITASFSDVYGEAGQGLGLTYTYNYGRLYGLLPPILRLDYIFTGSYISPRAAQVLPSGGSDHRPVYAELSVNLDPSAS
jgi:vancomycin resistance protein VanJ